MRRKKKLDGWYVQRGYAHIDRALSFDAAERLVTDPRKIAKLSFFPMLGYADRKRKFGRDNSIRSLPKKARPKVVKTKIRELKYASHRDSYIYIYYAMLLQTSYEQFLKAQSLEDCVVGYRAGIGSNVDLAARAFAEISARRSCSVHCYDIKDFFPSIPHKGLKFAIAKVLGTSMLSPDWYNIYRSLTRFNWIDIDQLFLCCLIDPKQGVPNPLCTDPIELLDAMRAGGMIRRNPPGSGIPQGTPISAAMANVAMLEFDLIMQNWAKDNSAFYMRYSDDIIIISDYINTDDMNATVKSALATVGPGLEISFDKTEISIFTPNGSDVTCDRPVTYLGFTFDGKLVRLRDRTLSRYYRRMTYSTRRTDKFARDAFKKGGSREPHKRKLISQFTHLGRSNFYSYAKSAQSTFGGNAIRRQLRRHFEIMMRKLKNRGK